MSCDLAESCVFSKQSLPLFLCNLLPGSGREALHHSRHTFSLSYSANLPSSLTRGLSSALEYSSGPPVSVCGTSAHDIHCRGFSREHSFGEFAQLLAALHRLSELSALRLSLSRPIMPSYGLEPVTNTPARLTFSVPAAIQTHHLRCRNINLLSIDYAFLPRLRSRLTPGGKSWPGKPWACGEYVSHIFYRYSCQHLLLKALRNVLPILLRRALQCSPTAHAYRMSPQLRYPS